MKNKFLNAISLAVIFSLLITSLALADDVYNGLDGSIDAIAETMPLNVGGSDGSTMLYIQPRNSDGKNGCNLTSSATLVVSINSSDSSVATVSPNSATFTSCGDTPTLTITPHNQGSATISVSQTSNDTGATFNFAPATFTVNVAPPANTAPQVTVVGVDGVSYEIGFVPAATCDVIDAEDGNSSFPATLSSVSGSLAAYGLGGQTASCDYTDGGGLTASASVTYSIVDTTAPVITFVNRTAANANGWNNGDVTVEWSCTDTGSGVVDASVFQTVSAEGANQSATGTCADHAGNTASDIQTGINIDLTAPTASASASPEPNANGWNKTTVTVSFSGNDSLSGIDFCDAAVVLSSEGAGQSASGICTDKAGNVSATASANNINIDLTNPTVALVGGPADGSSHYFGFVPAAPTCTASDALSGLAGACSVSGYGTTVGGHTVTASASDNAGNQGTDSASYEVLAWTLNGFYQPVDMNGVWNTVKGGSTVPLKFEIFAGSTELKLTSYVTGFTAQTATCPNGNVTTDAIEVLATGGTSLRFDTTGDQFIYNWQTPKLPGRCYVVTMTTQDGSTLSANFILK